MQAPQTSAEAADTAARVALAAAHAGLGPAQQAQEEARAARLRHTIVEDVPGALGGSGRPAGSLMPDGGLSSPSGPESSENSFSRYCITFASHMMSSTQGKGDCAALTRVVCSSSLCFIYQHQTSLPVHHPERGPVAGHGLSMGMPNKVSLARCHHFNMLHLGQQRLHGFARHDARILTDTLACRGLQSAMAGLGGTGPPVTVRLEVIGDYSRDELAAAEAADQSSSEPCQHRQSAADGSLPARGSQGALHPACPADDALPGDALEGSLL